MKNKKIAKKILATKLAICLLVVAIIPLGGCTGIVARFTEDPIQYTYVLVHGMGGWGESAELNEITPYWGSTTGGLSAYLRSQGHLVEEKKLQY